MLAQATLIFMINVLRKSSSLSTRMVQTLCSGYANQQCHHKLCICWPLWIMIYSIAKWIIRQKMYLELRKSI